MTTEELLRSRFCSTASKPLESAPESGGDMSSLRKQMMERILTPKTDAAPASEDGGERKTVGGLLEAVMKNKSDLTALEEAQKDSLRKRVPPPRGDIIRGIL